MFRPYLACRCTGATATQSARCASASAAGTGPQYVLAAACRCHEEGIAPDHAISLPAPREKPSRSMPAGVPGQPTKGIEIRPCDCRYIGSQSGGRVRSRRPSRYLPWGAEYAARWSRYPPPDSGTLQCAPHARIRRHPHLKRRCFTCASDPPRRSGESRRHPGIASSSDPRQARQLRPTRRECRRSCRQYRHQDPAPPPRGILVESPLREGDRSRCLSLSLPRLPAGCLFQTSRGNAHRVDSRAPQAAFQRRQAGVGLIEVSGLVQQAFRAHHVAVAFVDGKRDLRPAKLRFGSGDEAVDFGHGTLRAPTTERKAIGMGSLDSL